MIIQSEVCLALLLHVTVIPVLHCIVMPYFTDFHFCNGRTESVIQNPYLFFA